MLSIVGWRDKWQAEPGAFGFIAYVAASLPRRSLQRDVGEDLQLMAQAPRGRRGRLPGPYGQCGEWKHGDLVYLVTSFLPAVH